MSRLRHRTRWVSLFTLSCALLSLLISLLFVPLPEAKPYSPVILDRNGEFLHSFRASDGIWRLRTTPGEIPDKLKTLLLEKEDRYFYYHPGINPFAVVRALFQNARSGKRVSGASTLTMQLARMLEPRERTYRSKLIEMFRAIQLEIRYSKEEILELYFSFIPMGGNLEGLKSASLMYYGTPLERLNIAHLIDLILIPNDPNGLRPDRNPDRLFAARLEQTSRWLGSGLLSPDDSSTIRSTPAFAERRELPRLAPHFSLRVQEKLTRNSEIYTTLDLAIQRAVQRLMRNHLRSWEQQGVFNGAVLVIENPTSEVIAYAGSGDFDDEKSEGQVDAVRALRSPGSTLKPLLYAFAIDRGILTPELRLLDTPYDSEGFSAENYDGKFSGLVSAADALRRSLNVPMIRLLQASGFHSFVEMTSRTGFHSLTVQKNKLGLSMILGGCGVTLEELTAAYTVFPLRGKYVQPRFLRLETPPVVTDVFTPAATYIVTDILTSVHRPDLPNSFESSMSLPTIAFKTGTSYGRRDAWAIGYTAKYTVGVWMGNVDNSGVPDLVGGSTAAPLLVDIVNSISPRNEKNILPKPDDLGVREVCAVSGDMATPLCDAILDDYYSKTTSSVMTCRQHKEFMIAVDRSCLYCPSCVTGNPYINETLVDYPKDVLFFWKQTGQPFTATPPHNPLCTTVGGTGPTIISPTDAMVYYLTSHGQRIVLQASSSIEASDCAWYVNDRYLGRQQSGGKLFVSFKQGEHTVLCLDDRGRTSSVQIQVHGTW